jgi:hypothetical protein
MPDFGGRSIFMKKFTDFNAKIIFHLAGIINILLKAQPHCFYRPDDLAFVF